MGVSILTSSTYLKILGIERPQITTEKKKPIEKIVLKKGERVNIFPLHVYSLLDFYIWKNESLAKAYYEYDNCFICPECVTVSNSWEQFCMIIAMLMVLKLKRQIFT